MATKELRRMGRAELEAELEALRAIPDLRAHAVPCVFPRACAVCSPAFGPPVPVAVIVPDWTDLDQVAWAAAYRRSVRACPNNPPCGSCQRAGVPYVGSTEGLSTDRAAPPLEHPITVQNRAADSLLLGWLYVDGGLQDLCQTCGAARSEHPFDRALVRRRIFDLDVVHCLRGVRQNA